MKLGDFGISKRVSNPSTALRTEVGTRAFSAPETTPDNYEETFQYTNAVDMWSLGCVIYNVLAHCLPYKNSQAKSLPFPAQPLKDRVDDQGIDLLECLLRVDPSTRWPAQKAAKHPWLAASSDAAGTAKSIAQPERPNESQDKPIRPEEQVNMPTFISSMENTCPKPTDQTETPINQLTSQSAGHRGKNGLSNSSSNNDGRRRTSSNMLSSPSNYGSSDSSEDLGIETLMPRRASYRLPEDASRDLHEGNTIKKPTSSTVRPTIVSRPPRQRSKLANTGASRDRASSLDSIDPSLIVREMRRPTLIEGLLMSSSSSDNKDEGATQKEPLVKVHHNALPMRRHRIPEKQGLGKMELVNTLRALYQQESHQEQNKIARALELIRKGVDLEMRYNGETALHLAVRFRYFQNAGNVTQILHELLERGADVNARNDRGNTALHLALFYSDARHNENEIEIVRQLLRYKADVNAESFEVSSTPLHYAAQHLYGVYIDVLLAAGARINELDVSNWTALHRAAFNKKQGKIVARKLILAGIKMDVIDESGETALNKARQEGNSGVVEMIEEAQEQRRRSHGKGKEARIGFWKKFGDAFMGPMQPEWLS